MGSTTLSRIMHLGCAIPMIIGAGLQTVHADARMYGYAPPPFALPTAGFHGQLQTAISLGGDKLDTVIVRDYTYSTRRNTRAGELLNVGGGLLYQLPNSPFSISATANWAGDLIFEGATRVGFQRFPMELMACLQLDRHRFGLGGTRHVDVRRTAEYVENNKDNESLIKYDDANGVVAEYSYGMTPQMWLTLKYTDIAYKENYNSVNGVRNTLSTAEVDGSNVAFGIRGIF